MCRSGRWWADDEGVEGVEALGFGGAARDDRAGADAGIRELADFFSVEGIEGGFGFDVVQARDEELSADDAVVGDDFLAFGDDGFPEDGSAPGAASTMRVLGAW